ncbi:hypothetical protein [Thalassobacillus sp. CUG 92003]|uniref:hypothetical protein n=1 Tax=Thalassobacillus sp. CUG 92003 TaxID=2736641 RepID=UPI0015E6F742|nr:hypothetical protein [Thalassobacillus sp. CUG 92003]
MNGVGTTINPGNLTVTKHARQRAQERFKVAPNNAEKWFRKQMANAEFVTWITQEDGRKLRMFTRDKITLILDPEVDRIVSVYPQQETGKPRELVRQFARHQIVASERTQNRTLRQLNVLRAKIERELADRKAQLKRVRNPERKIVVQARIKALEARLSDLPEEKTEAQREHVVRARGFARVL